MKINIDQWHMSIGTSYISVQICIIPRLRSLTFVQLFQLNNFISDSEEEWWWVRRSASCVRNRRQCSRACIDDNEGDIKTLAENNSNEDEENEVLHPESVVANVRLYSSTLPPPDRRHELKVLWLKQQRNVFTTFYGKLTPPRKMRILLICLEIVVQKSFTQSFCKQLVINHSLKFWDIYMFVRVAYCFKCL